MISTFTAPFDFTFGLPVTPAPELPPVGGDGAHVAGGRVAGAVLPFALDPALLPSCGPVGGTSPAQDWDRWTGVVSTLPDYLLPFVLAVPRPADIPGSPYCTEALSLLDARTGEVLRTLGEAPLLRYADARSLYVMHVGSRIDTVLPDGTYRFQLGPAISEVFTVYCNACSLIRIRLGNDTRIGDLLYDRPDPEQGGPFEQVFFAEGALTGPTYEESEVRQNGERSSATVRKVWTLRLAGVAENIADALALVSLHRVVELQTGGPLGRTISALAYGAKTRVSLSDAGGLDVELTLPVSAAEFRASGSGAGCLVDSPDELFPIDCDGGNV